MLYDQNNRRDLIKLQIFHNRNDTVNRTKHKPSDWEIFYTNPASDRGLISNIYKKLRNFDARQPNNPIKNGVQS